MRPSRKVVLGVLAGGSLVAASASSGTGPTGGEASHPAEQRPAALVVYPGASDVSFVERKDGICQVSYTVAIAYPAEPVLEHIRKELSRQRWSPLPEDFLNPGRPSSHTQGWTQFGDMGTPGARIDQWLAQWRNAAGEVVWYALRYQSHGSGTGRETLHVYAGFESREIADAQRSWVEGEARSQEQERLSREARARAPRAPCEKSGPVELRLASRSEKGAPGAVPGPDGDWLVLDKDTLVNACEFRGADVEESAGHCVVALHFAHEVEDRLIVATSNRLGQPVAVLAHGQVVAAPGLAGPIGESAAIELGSCEKARTFVAELRAESLR